MPLFSVITITFNNRESLQRTSLSIQQQTYDDYEWIIIDGASTDGSKDDFINYPSAKIISEMDKGIYDAMNKGIDTATGDYIIFMNAGDCFAGNNILLHLSKSCLTLPDFIYGDSEEDNHLKKARHHSKINWGMFTHHQAMLYNRRVLKDLRYNLDYKIAADYDLTIRFLKSAKNIVYVPIPICIFETGGISQQNAKQGRDEQFFSRNKNHACGFFTNQAIRLAQRIRIFVRQNFSEIYWLLIKT